MKKYWHEIPDEEVKELLDRKMKIDEVINSYSQPSWCTYPEALGGTMGCWSLMDCFGTRKQISHDFCKTCECYEKA